MSERLQEQLQQPWYTPSQGVAEDETQSSLINLLYIHSEDRRRQVHRNKDECQDGDC